MTLPAETEKQIISMYRAGTSTNNIGRSLGFHKCYAVAVLRQNHIPLRYRRMTPVETAAMGELYKKYVSGPEIAKQFSTTPTAVYAALRRRNVKCRPPYNGLLADCDHDFFNRIDTEPKAYFLAVLSGDGWVTGTNEIGLGLKAADVDLVEAWRATLQIGNPVRRSEVEKLFRGYRLKYKAATVTVKSPLLAEALAKYGIVPAKTGRMVPALIPEQVPGRLEKPYWRGWVDSDGWVCPRLTPVKLADGKRRQFEVGLRGDRPVVEAFRDFCKRHTPTKAEIQPNNGIWSFAVTDSYAMRIASLLYDGATVYLERKHQAYLEWRTHMPDWIPGRSA